MIIINMGFCLKLCSDLDFEGMVIDICFNDHTIAMINYDKDIENLEIKIVGGREPNEISFPLQGFIEALDRAKHLAIRCAREDNQKVHSDINDI